MSKIITLFSSSLHLMQSATAVDHTYNCSIHAAWNDPRLKFDQNPVWILHFLVQNRTRLDIIFIEISYEPSSILNEEVENSDRVLIKFQSRIIPSGMNWAVVRMIHGCSALHWMPRRWSKRIIWRLINQLSS